MAIKNTIKMTNLNLEQKVIVSDDVLFQILGGETVLLNMETEQYFGLNEIGSKIWELISKEKLISEVLTELLNDVTAHAEMQAITSAANFDQLCLDIEHSYY